MKQSNLVRLSDEISAEYLEFNGIVPISVDKTGATVGSWRDNVDSDVLDDLRVLFKAPVRVVEVAEPFGLAAVRRLYANASSSTAMLEPSVLESLGVSDLRTLANEAPVVQAVNLLLLEGLERRASDIHLELEPEGLVVRHRVDGILRLGTSPAPHMAAALLSRLRIMAGLDIAERRVPLDGRMRLRLQDRDVDVRISTIPTAHGESVALRLLDASLNRIALDGIGMPPLLLARFRRMLDHKQGMILVTGPTGSGKTTTLYAAIEAIRTGKDKIITIEDPVEYQLTGITQMPIARRHGMTFAAALRAVLRHDPDVILLGEIRDVETAEVAVQAALTGHLVLSTLHTTDAAGAIDRLLDLGVEPYLIAATLHGVIAQRLVRMVCACTRDGAAQHDCADCGGTRFHGRTGLYELVEITGTLADALHDGGSAEHCRAAARAVGARSLADAAADLIETGITTLDEVRRVINAGADS